MHEEAEDWPRLISLAVHELRTPVNVSGGYLKMLGDERSGPLTERQRRLLDLASTSCARTAALLADLSELAKLDAGVVSVQVQTFDVDALLGEVVSGFQSPPDTQVAVELRQTTTGTMVAGDRSRLGRAFSACLVALARELPDGGRIIVESRRDATGGGAIVLIAEARLLPSFDDAGFQWGPADEWRGGVGVELPLARRVVQRSRGAMRSPAGSGRQAGFRFDLPPGRGERL
jgi:signal transduction histidine kinase